ncbi:MAG: adenylyl-sulfate kinase [Desulfocapsaceae bacterium]|nr:adenylyl-sulfate kinase [Desulfosporosinus sp.]MDR3629544.1 adenylyl-sulfate kinase [Desulfocapsaceae bacterium]
MHLLPLRSCEKRDRRGLNAKARPGKVLVVTGITDPNILPTGPELTVTSHITSMEAAQEILQYRQSQGCIS